MSEVAEKIASEIADRGAIPFARFMELALYCPVYGYYEKEGDTPGQRGDYYTSVSVGPLFGQLLAAQFARWLDELPGRDAPGGKQPGGSAESAHASLQLVEAGAHRGQLARDILLFLHERLPDLYQRLEYWIIEPSERRQQWQQSTLAQFQPKVHWAPSLSALKGGKPAIRGVIFSNELFDSFPVHRLGWDARDRCWFEWGVNMNNGRFSWTRLPAPPALSRYPSLVSLDLLPEDFTLETCPTAEQWWSQAAGLLDSGKLLTIDYGLTTDEWVAPQRNEGTLRAYYKHQVVADVLAHPGEQDLTAHVNFTTLQKAGESAGLKTETFDTQSQFLTRIAAQMWTNDRAFGEWTAKSTRQFQTLTHPDHLGRAFRVLVQSRAQ